MFRLPLIGILVLLAGCTSAPSPLIPQLYYVSPMGDDTSTGSLDHPFLTLAHATSLLRPGDSLLLLDGVYTEPFTLTLSGVNGRPIRIAAAPGANPVLSPNSYWAIHITGQFLVLEKLRIETQTNGILLDKDSASTTLNNLTILAQNTSIWVNGDGHAIFNTTIDGGKTGVVINSSRTLFDHLSIRQERIGILDQGENTLIRFSSLTQNGEAAILRGNNTRLSHVVVAQNDDGVLVQTANHAWLAHLTVVQNKGAGVYFSPLSSHPILINSIASGNGEDVAEHSSTGEVIHTLTLVDPALTDTFHLTQGSLAIHAGLPLVGEELDSEGNRHGSEPSLGAFEYTGPPEPVLSIENVSIRTDSSSLYISWTTNKPATSRIEYGNTSQYNNATTKEGEVQEHEISIAGLTPQHLYFFRIISTTWREFAESEQNATTDSGHAIWYASPSATQRGNGSANNPWTLEDALLEVNTIKPGDRIILSRGTYDGCYFSSLRGELGKEITIEPDVGELVILQPARNCSDALLKIDGKWITFRNIEISDPQTNRTANETNSTPGLPIGILIQTFAEGVRLEQLYIHDIAGTAIHALSSTRNITITDSLITATGLSELDDAVVMEGTGTVEDTIIAGTSARGLVASGGIVIRGNVVFHSGEFIRNVSEANYEVTQSLSDNMIFTDNVGFQNDGLNVLYGNSNCHSIFAWNYLAGGTVQVKCTLDAEGNTFSGASVVGVEGGNEAPQPWVRVHSANRARSTIVFHSLEPSFRLNLSLLHFRTGEHYELRNVQDYDVDIQTGIWNGVSVVFNMTPHTVRTPTRGSPMQKTFPQFGVFILLRTTG